MGHFLQAQLAFGYSPIPFMSQVLVSSGPGNVYLLEKLERDSGTPKTGQERAEGRRRGIGRGRLRLGLASASEKIQPEVLLVFNGRGRPRSLHFHP